MDGWGPAFRGNWWNYVCRWGACTKSVNRSDTSVLHCIYYRAESESERAVSRVGCVEKGDW